MEYQFNLLHTLNKQLESLPKAEKIVALYIVENSTSIPNLNIHELSEKSGGTPSAITRLCKRLDVKGYSHLRLQIMSELSRKTAHGDKGEPAPVNPDMEITHSLIKKTIETLRDIESTIDIRRIREAADFIARARRIDIYGTGASSLVAYDLHMKLQRIGLNSHFSMSEHMQLTGACNLDRRDAAIALSFSGETEEVLRSARMAAEQNACLITMTSNVANSLADLAEIPLYVPVSEPLFRIGAMSSRIAQLVLVDILFYYITQNDPEGIMNKLVRTDRALKKEKS